MTLSRFLKISTFIGLGGYTTYVLQQNDWNVRHIGLVRLGTAASTVATIAIDYKWSVAHLRDQSEETLEKWSKCHQRSANRLLKLCSDNGGVFIKVGQHIAALDYLVPQEYVKTLKVLHNQAPRSTLESIKAAIRKELGKDTDELFAEFDENALASASLAQVYRARLKDSNEEVAVKVQHPNVFKHSLVDIATMDFLARVIDKIFPDFSFNWLVEEMRRNLPMELDFINEGKNGEKIAHLLKNIKWLKVPKIHWKYSTERVLCMEFVQGKLINDKKYFEEDHLNTKEIARRFEEIYGQMIFIHGTVHCDPHPGNVLVKKINNNNDFYLYLLDHGLYVQLTNEFRYNYSSFLLAIFRGDVPEIKRSAMELGVQEDQATTLSCMVTAKSLSAVMRGLENPPASEEQAAQEKQLFKSHASMYFDKIMHVLAKVDRQLLLVMKTNDLIRYISKGLGLDERQSLINMNRFCVDAVTEYKLSQSTGIFRSTIIRIQHRLIHFRLTMLSFFLSLSSWFRWRTRAPQKTQLEA